jgi:hypothetical protein
MNVSYELAQRFESKRTCGLHPADPRTYILEIPCTKNMHREETVPCQIPYLSLTQTPGFVGGVRCGTAVPPAPAAVMGAQTILLI